MFGIFTKEGKNYKIKRLKIFKILKNFGFIG